MKLKNAFGNDAIFRYWFEFAMFAVVTFAIVVTGIAVF